MRRSQGPSCAEKTPVFLSSPPPSPSPRPRVTQWQQNALGPGGRLLRSLTDHLAIKEGGAEAAFVRGYFVHPPPPLPPSRTPSPLPRMARQPEARAFHSEFHGLIKCRGCFPGDLKALLCAPWRVRLSPAFGQQASVCLQRGLLMGGGGREGGEGNPLQKGGFVFAGANPRLPLDRNQAHVNRPPTALRALPNQCD